MPSKPLQTWTTDQTKALDQFEQIYTLIDSTKQGSPSIEQIDHAYVLLLSSQFQKFCRNLHTESRDYLVESIKSDSMLQHILPILEKNFYHKRKLDEGNPDSGNIGSDFNRLGLDFWTEVKKTGKEKTGEKDQLDQLIGWRNMIAHHDFESDRSRTLLRALPKLCLATIRDFRSACDNLALSFDCVMREHIQRITKTAPWS